MDFGEWMQYQELVDLFEYKKPWVLNYGNRALKRKKKTGEMLLQRLWKIGYPTYESYLESPHWKQFKNLYYTQHPRICFITGLPATELHHIRYENLGHESFDDVVPLSDAMHKLVHHVSETYGIPLNKAHIYLRDTLKKLFQLGMAHNAPMKMKKPKFKHF